MQQTSLSSRPDPVAVALANLSDVRKPGTVFVGPVGCGKTFMLQAVMHGVRSSAKLSSRSLTVHPCHRTRDIEAALAVDPPATGPKVLAVDDLETLSPRALRLLSSAIDESQIQIVGTVRSDAAGVVMNSLRPCRVPVLLEIPAWDDRQLAQRALTVFDGPLSRWSAHQLVRFTGGNPLCLNELLEQGKTSNDLDRRESVWVWTGEPRVPTATSARFEGTLRALPSGCRKVLVCLAVLGSIEEVHLTRVAAEQDVQAAAAAGLMEGRIDENGRVILAATRPLVGHMLVSQMTLLQLRHLCAVLVAELLPQTLWNGGIDAGQTAKVAELCRRTGMALPADLRESLAVACLQAHEPEIASWLLATLAPTEAVVGLRLRSLVDQCRFTEAADLLQLNQPGAPLYGVETGTRRERADSLRPQGWQDASAARALEAMADGASALPAAEWASSDWTDWASCWTGHRLEELCRTGERKLASRGGSEVFSKERHQHLLTRTMACALQAGRVEDTLRLARWPTASEVSGFQAAFRLAWWTVTSLAHLYRGALREAARSAKALVRMGLDENWPLAYSLGNLVAGRLALVQAEPQHAVHYITESIAVPSRGAVSLSSQLGRESLALAYVMAGDVQGADRIHQAADVDGATSAPQFFRSLTVLTRSEALYCLGHRHGALRLLDDLRKATQSTDQHLTTFLGAFLASRIDPAPSRCAQLSDRGRATDFELAQLNVRHGVAVERGDGRALSQVADDYATRGLRWRAAEAAAEALRTAASTPMSAGWTATARKYVTEIGRSGILIPGWSESSTPTVSLTGREQEIAEAVAIGRTAAEVADELHLSPRTVENHLQHVYRKLGISRRSELAKALAGIITAPNDPTSHHPEPSSWDGLSI